MVEHLFNGLFFLGIPLVFATIFIMPIGLMSFLYDLSRKRAFAVKRAFANKCWVISALYLLVFIFWIISPFGRNVSSFDLPPFMVIPGILSVLYVYFSFS